MVNNTPIPEEVRTLRNEFDNALNHFLNIKNFVEWGIIEADDYEDRKAELVGILKSKLYDLELKGYGLL